jgi:hypothetical protein
MDMSEFRVTKRGYATGDTSDFSPAALALLGRASEEVSYLVDRDYPRDTVITFVGNRYQLSARQRLLLARAVSGRTAARKRERKRLGTDKLEGSLVLIDGFNTLITLEVALSGSPVVIGQDGTTRDLAGLRGTYHIIDKTPRAIDLVLDTLDSIGVREAQFLFDAPVSNSGRVSKLVRSVARQHHLEAEATTSEKVDATLSASERVVTSDSVILDSCISWFNLGALIVARLREEHVEHLWTIDIFDRLGTA